MAELSSIKPSEYQLKLSHPSTGKYIGITVSVMSINDDRMKTLMRRIHDARLKLEARGKNFKSEDIEENGLEIAFAAMTGWHWEKDEDGVEATFDGKKLEFNKENVKYLLTKLPWMKMQIDIAISEDRNFFPS